MTGDVNFHVYVTWYFQTPSNYSLYEGERKKGREKETEKETKRWGDGDGEREKLSFLKAATGPGSILHTRM